MKIVIILSLLLFAQLCCASLSATNSACSECEQGKLQMVLQVAQLQKTIADLRTENAKLQLELLQIREEKHTLSEEINMNFMNCSALRNDAEFLSSNFKILSDDVKKFNTFFEKQAADDNTNCSALSSDAEYLSQQFESLSEVVKPFKSHKVSKIEDNFCLPRKFLGLKFFDIARYEKMCDFEKSNGEWTVIQRRLDGYTDFYRGWDEYKSGFGTMSGEFFIGLEILHLLTKCAPQELFIDMENFIFQERYARYDLFKIGDESEKYAILELGKYNGNAGDSLSYHKNQKFTTYDQDNDALTWGNCARERSGAWWYKDCQRSNLNGDYSSFAFGKSITWETFTGDLRSLRKVEMKIRPRQP